LLGEREGVPDGMKVDTEGNVYCGGAGGLHIMNAGGETLGIVVHGQPATTNLCFGGADWRTLYFTSRNTVGSVPIKVAGLPVPAK
jgi:gluconolactonase